MKALRALFDSQSKQSEKLVQELADHEKSWPAVKAAYDERDKECVASAAQLAAARLAGSPTALSIEVELKQRRLERDRTKADFSRQRDQISVQLEAITSPEIRRFCDEALQRAKDLHKLRRVETGQTWFTPAGAKIVTVTHNAG